MRVFRFFAFVVPLGAMLAMGFYFFSAKEGISYDNKLISSAASDKQDERTVKEAEESRSELQKKERIMLAIRSARISVELADTPEKQVQGLSGRELLPPDGGMLFRYRAPGRYSFWMKDMRFSLDFIWIADGRVVGVTENVSPETFPKAIKPEALVTDVLEVNAGFVEQYGITVGDKVAFE